MTIKEVRKQFKSMFGYLPMNQKKYIELKAMHRLRQTESNRALAPILEENKKRRQFDAVCNFEGVK